MTLLPSEETDRLRRLHYNAALEKVFEVHPELRILRVRPDDGVPVFEPGQYTALGLGNWEPRVADTQEETLTPEQQTKMARRAYSISCSLLDEDGKPRRPADFPYLEFYVALVRRAEKRPPALTPRLFAMQPGDRLYVQPKIAGSYTLAEVKPDDNVVFLATGTGEAPHNAMAAELLGRGHAGRIAQVTTTRYRKDLAYRDTQHELERRFANYRYLTLTTREPENLDPSVPNYIGKRYLQAFIQSGEFEQQSGIPLKPGAVHVFLCGNPAMIGVPLKQPDGQFRPQPGGVIELLEQRGLHADQPRKPGNIHFERYW